MTWPAAHGLETARRTRRALVEDAIAGLAQLDSRADPLRAVARYIIERRR
jgi:geranylgeranyl diphosphate synthase, type II